MFLNIFPSRSIFSFRKALLIIVPLLATVFVFWKFFLVVNAPFRLDYAEGFIYTNTVSILHGIPIYHSVESAPYTFGFYTPLYNYIGALFLKLFSPSISVLRLMTFILFLATGVGVGYLVKKMTKSVFGAVFATLLFCSAFIVSQWSSIVRPDMLGLCLTTLGILVVIVGNPKSYGKLLLAAFIFSLAFFSKQSFVVAPFAYFLSLLFINRKGAWSFAGAYVLCMATGILLLNAFTHGEFIRQVFVYPGVVPYGNLHAAFRIAAITGISALPLVAVAAKKITQSPKSFFSLYLLSSLLTFAMLLRDGGIQNYLLEFVLALILIAATSIPWEKLQTVPAKRLYPALFAVQFFFILWSYAALPWETKAYTTERLSVFNKETSTIGQKTKILVEDPLVAYAVSSAVEIDPYTFGQVAESGLVSTVKLFSEVKVGAYKYIDDYGAFNRIPGLMDIIKTNFRPASTLTFSKPVKPFDYSLYNRHTITNIGTLYKYDPGKATTGD